MLEPIPDIVEGQEYTSKIKRLLGEPRRNENKFGVTYFYNLEFENGIIGSIGKKKENAFAVGDSLTFTAKKNGNFVNLTEAGANKGFGGGGGRGFTPAPPPHAHHALTIAKDVFIERNRTNPVATTPTDIANGICSVAKIFLKFLKEES